MCRRSDLHGALDWHAAVLEVDPDHPVAGGAGHPRDVSRTRMAHAECQDCLSSRQPADDSHWCLSLHADMVHPGGVRAPIQFSRAVICGPKSMNEQQ
jgi:hypothetical protein